MSVKMSDMPCPSGGTHVAGPVIKVMTNVSTITCGKCDAVWADIVAQIEAEYIPDAATAECYRWQGSTYEWEFDGKYWYSPSAPGGASLFNDLPLRPVVVTYGETWSKSGS